MISAIQIANFKAFAAAQRIPIKPLTLIYGANSSGKSSIIHSLALAKHALETGELDIHRTTLGGDAIDLGGFRQFVHKREANRRVEWAMDLDASMFQGGLAELLAPVKKLTVLFSIGIELDDQDRPRPEASPEIYTYELLADGHNLLRMSRRKDGKLKLDRLDHQHPVFREVIKALVMMSTTTDTIHQDDFEGLDEAIAELVPHVVASSTRFLPDGLERSTSFRADGQNALYTISKANRREDLGAAVRSFLPRKLDGLLKGVRNSVSSELDRFKYLGPLRSYPARHLAFSQHNDPNWYAGGGYAWDVVRRDVGVRAKVNEWLSAQDRLQTPYELMVRDLVGIDQLEEPLLEGLEIINAEGLDIEPDYDDEPTPSGAYPVISDPEVEATKLCDLIRSSDIDKLHELIMVDRRSNTVVSHRDVGIGVSQVLPVLVTAFASINQIIAIEQPEIHLHPALQGDLGDLLIHSALGGDKNIFVVESHSEHLLLRLMRRMRETYHDKLPNNFPKVSPEDVSVLFVEPDGSRSIIREMPLNENGELVKAWPGGFFEEGLREIF